MKITATVQKTFDDGKTRAICDVNIGGEFVIHGVKLIEGSNGRFISMPGNQWKNAHGEVQHSDVVHPLSAETRAELVNAVENAYDVYLEKQVTEDLPFGVK